MREMVQKWAKTKLCFCCGSTDQEQITKDHFLPKFVFKLPETKGDGNPPFNNVVIKKENIFPLCRDDHTKIDHEKFIRFNGNNPADLNPVDLIIFLREYPITEDPRYKIRQITNMVKTYQRFIGAAFNLEQEYKAKLKDRFEEAAQEASVNIVLLNRSLVEARQSQTTVDITRLLLLKYPDHTSSARRFS